ncbi:hypothetical protein B0T24DRAFT_51349 [Lasiosphaeria ovina]|uniref:Uncharacterized protein n=1 Tax=Lasiosphaeria ovina TaxID=92902 RepID=A0AAE0TXV8_9PEZI|nr:hypothetical protein B0T24DRAFT_51349 [Lasiosphaeria ovina]
MTLCGSTRPRPCILQQSLPMATASWGQTLAESLPRCHPHKESLRTAGGVSVGGILRRIVTAKMECLLPRPSARRQVSAHNGLSRLVERQMRGKAHCFCQAAGKHGQCKRSSQCACCVPPNENLADPWGSSSDLQIPPEVVEKTWEIRDAEGTSAFLGLLPSLTSTTVHTANCKLQTRKEEPRTTLCDLRLFPT